MISLTNLLRRGEDTSTTDPVQNIKPPRVIYDRADESLPPKAAKRRAQAELARLEAAKIMTRELR